MQVNNMEIHEHYNQLTSLEQDMIDDMFNTLFTAFKYARKTEGININYFLNGDDRAERAIDAVAKWVLESRNNTNT